jgi:preprotein translocase subunit YajC
MKNILKLGFIAGLLAAAPVFAGGCLAPADGGSQQSPIFLIVFLVLIFAFFYFVMVRPQRQRQKAQQDLMSQLQKGDKIMTAGGIHGVVESLDEETVVIKVESGTLRVARGSVVVRQEK